MGFPCEHIIDYRGFTEFAVGDVVAVGSDKDLRKVVAALHVLSHLEIFTESNITRFRFFVYIYFYSC